ncbi:MAG: Gfo/Idh/MocA family oxidoreductase, partial [Gemmatimonadetes bacterium]|nr:Gfo/Idh/MocA family oxidoreductase [Gemmatimonadota bacterium]
AGDRRLMERSSEAEYLPVKCPESPVDDSLVTSFLSNIRRDEDEPPTFRDGLAAQLVIDAAVKSHETGSWVDVEC